MAQEIVQIANNTIWYDNNFYAANIDAYPNPLIELVHRASSNVVCIIYYQMIVWKNVQYVNGTPAAAFGGLRINLVNA